MENENLCEIRVYSPSFEWLGMISNAESVRFRRDWLNVGGFEIHINADKAFASLLTRPDNVIVINRDSSLSGVVRDFVIKEGGDGAELVAFGESGQGFAKRRVVLPDDGAASQGYDRFRGRAEAVVKHYLAAHLTAAADVKRNMPRLRVSPDLGRGVDMPWSARYTQLDATLREICAFAGIGWGVRADVAAKEWVADVIVGADRSGGVVGVAPVVFRAQYGNVEGYSYTEDAQNARTTVYCLGAGTDENRLKYCLGGESAGAARRETVTEKVGERDLSELAYYGERKLNACAAVKSVRLDAGGNVFAFGRDYFLGDSVGVIVERLGLKTAMTVSEAVDVWEASSGHRREVRLGGDLPNIFSVLMRGEVS